MVLMVPEAAQIYNLESESWCWCWCPSSGGVCWCWCLSRPPGPLPLAPPAAAVGVVGTGTTAVLGVPGASAGGTQPPTCHFPGRVCLGRVCLGMLGREAQVPGAAELKCPSAVSFFPRHRNAKKCRMPTREMMPSSQGSIGKLKGGPQPRPPPCPSYFEQKTASKSQKPRKTGASRHNNAICTTSVFSSTKHPMCFFPVQLCSGMKTFLKYFFVEILMQLNFIIFF